MRPTQSSAKADHFLVGRIGLDFDIRRRRGIVCELNRVRAKVLVLEEAILIRSRRPLLHNKRSALRTPARRQMELTISWIC